MEVKSKKKCNSEDERRFAGAVQTMVIAPGNTDIALDKVDGKTYICGTDFCDANSTGVADCKDVAASFPFMYVLQYDVLSECSFRVKDYTDCNGYTWRGSRRENKY